MFNIVPYQNSLVFKLRFQHLEESLRNAPSRKNIVQEVGSGKN